MREKKYKVGDRVKVLFSDRDAVGTVCFSCDDPWWYHVKLDSGATVLRPENLLHLISGVGNGRAQADIEKPSRTGR